MDSSEEGTTPDEKADDEVSMETEAEKTEEGAEDQNNVTAMKDDHVVMETTITTEDGHLNLDEAPVVELCVNEINIGVTTAPGSDGVPEDDDMEPPVLTPELVPDLHKEQNVAPTSQQVEISEAVVVTSDDIGVGEMVDRSDTSSEDSVEIRIEETEVVVDTEVKDDSSENVVREVVITTVTQDEENLQDSIGDSNSIRDTETGKRTSQGAKRGNTPVQKNTRQRVVHLRSKGPELRQKSVAQKTLAVKQEIENAEALRQLKPKGSGPQVIFTIKQEKEETEEDEEDDDDEDEDDEEEDDSASLHVDVKSEDQGGFRPVRPVERQKMRPWMIELLDKGNIPGLSWQNRRDRIFRISWKHAAHNCFNRDRDSDLFERWAVHTGRHYEGNHKRWKANFRCALNSLPDVIELRDLGVRKGDNAFKVYKFLDTNDPVYKDRIDNKGKRTSSSYSRSSVGKYESKNVKATDIREIQLEEGGTLHTLLHAIELQQQGVVTEKTNEAKKTTSKRSSDKSSDISAEAKKQKTEDGAETKAGKVSLVQLNKSDQQAERKVDDPIQSVAKDTTKAGDKPTLAVPQQQNLGEVGMVIPPGTGFITFGKGAEQKIVLPIGKTGLDPTAATLSFPAVNMINTGADKGQGQEQKITIPLAQLAAVLAQSHQQQQQTVKTGVAGNVEIKQLEGVPALYSPPHPSSIAIAAKPSSLGILTPAGLTNLSVVSSLQQGQGQFVTFATGVTAAQGHMNTTLVSTQTTRTHPVAKAAEQKIPSTVLEAMDMSGNKIKCKPDTVASLQKTVTSQSGQTAKPLLSPTKHTVNKELTSLAAALKVRPPGQPTQIRPVFPTPINVNPAAKSVPGTSIPPVRSIESQGVRNKLVTRLLISGASTTTSSTQASSLPSSPNIPQPNLAQTGSPRPSLDLVIKPSQQVTPAPATPAQLQNLKTPSVPSILISSSGEPVQLLGNQNTRASDGAAVSSVPQSEQVAAPTIIQTAPQIPTLPVVATPQMVTTVGTPQVAAHQVATPPVAALGKENPPVTAASSSKNCPEFLEQVTIDLHDMQDVNKETAESSSSAAQQFAYSCLWCKIDFSKKIDLLQHFMNLHQDMLMVPGETEAAQGHLPAEGHTAVNQGQGQSVAEDALDLRTAGNKDGDAVRVEVVPYSEIIDMSCTRKRRKPKTVKEALIRKKKGNVESGTKDTSLPKGVKATSASGVSVSIEKRKRAKSKRNRNADKLTLSVEGGSGMGEGSTSGQMTPGSLSDAESQRPKYSLTSLIEALRESIERDKSKGPGVLADGLESNGAEGQVKAGEDVCYDDLSLSSLSDEDEDEDDILEVEGMNTRMGDTDENNVQVSVKTFQVDGKTMYKCSVCSKVFSKTCTFARHAMVHSKMYPYQCGLCDEKCSDMRVLLRHLDWHGENVDCPCKKCERLHKGNPDRKDSIRGTDGVNTSKFFCEICGREFLSDVACKAHVNMHKRGDNLVCEICHLSFYCNRVLSKHRKSAHGVQFCPYCLETCHLDMASHMSEHTGVYMYRCGLCGDGYNSRPLLHEHLKIHTHLGKEFSQDKRDSLESLSKKSHVGKHGDRLKSGALKSLNKKGKKKFMKGAKNKTVLSQKKTGKPKLIHTGEPGEITADGKAGKKNPARTMKRKCRWHDNDSVCERCDVSFVKKIAFGRKPKSKQGKDSPRPSESGSLDSFTLDGDNVKAKCNTSESPVKVVVNDHDYGTEVAQIANTVT